MLRRVAAGLTLVSAAIILVILLGSGFATYFMVEHSLSSNLTSDMDRAAATFGVSERFRRLFGSGFFPRQFADNNSALTAFPILSFGPSGELIDLVPGIGVEYQDLPWATLEPAGLAAALNGVPGVRSIPVNGHHLRVLSLPVRQGGVVGAVQVVASEDGHRSLLATLRNSLVGVGAAGVLAVIIGAYVVANRALRPVHDALARQRDFIANASHQLRTPVAIISADADALRRLLPGLEDEDRQILDDLIQESALLGRLVQQLISIARLESGPGPAAQERVDMSRLVQESVASITRLAHSGGLTITVDISRAGLAVVADPSQLRLALLGLLDNAVKYNEPHGSVQVSVRPRDEWAEVVIRNTGPGMALEEQRDVFRRFHRGTNASRRNPGGSGLGLALAKSLATQLGGDLSFSSEPGHGATTVLRLPLAGDASIEGTQEAHALGERR